MLSIGDKIKLVKPINMFDRVGDVFEVADIFADGDISFICEYGMGLISYSEFKRYFKKVVTLKWGEWQNIRFDNDNALYTYRTNGKRIQLKHGNLKASASCHENDNFNLNKGLTLCLARLLLKQIEAGM